jgi:hypothetical protein
MISCPKWIDVESPDGGKCGLNARTVSFGVCRICLDNTAPGEWPPAKTALQKLRLGTRISNATRAVGIKPCGGCKRRAMKLNGDTICRDKSQQH